MTWQILAAVHCRLHSLKLRDWVARAAYSLEPAVPKTFCHQPANMNMFRIALKTGKTEFMTTTTARTAHRRIPPPESGANTPHVVMCASSGGILWWKDPMEKQHGNQGFLVICRVYLQQKLHVGRIYTHKPQKGCPYA